MSTGGSSLVSQFVFMGLIVTTLSDNFESSDRVRACPHKLYISYIRRFEAVGT